MQLKETSGEHTDISNGDNNHEYRDKSQVSITHTEDASSQTECSESNAEKINTPDSGNIANVECTGETCLRTASYASATKEKNSKNQFADRRINGNLSDTCCSKNEQKNSNERSCDILSREKSNRNNADRMKSYADAIKSDRDSDKNILNINGKNSVEQENRYNFIEAQKDNKNCNMKITTISNGKTAEEERTKDIPHRKFDYETRNNIRNKRMLAPLAECPTEKSESKRVPEKNKRNSNLDVDNNLVEMCNKSHKISEKEKNCEGLTQSDSNRDNDEFEEDTAFMFLLPFRLCGSLIGKNGQFLKYIHSKTNVVVNIDYESNTCEEKLITVVGKESKVQAALDIIKNQFKHYPTLTFVKLNYPYHCECPPQLMVQPPVNLGFEVVVTSVVSPAHFFVIFPTLPQYYPPQSLYYCMTTHYNATPAPKLGTVKTRNIVVAPFHDTWLRAEVVNLLPDDKCEVKYLDMGGYDVVEKKDLRPVKAEFMQIPFQALECRLADVTCSEQSWTESSQKYFHSLVASQVLKAIVGYYDNNNIPHLYVYRIEHGMQIFINQAFVEAGLCSWSS